MWSRDKGLYKGMKIITSVMKLTRGQIVVVFEPNITDQVREKATVDDLANSSGYITVNETLLYFPDLKKKYIQSYDYYSARNGYEDSYDYNEELV